MSNVHEDVLWVYRNLGRAVTVDEAGPSRQALHEWASTNQKEFFKSMVPAAQAWSDKKGAEERRSAVVDEERKSISELQGILADALAAAAKGEDPNSLDSLLG